MTARDLVRALIGLVLLTLASWALHHVPLGPTATPFALVIAVTKAAIVVLVFMELRHASPTARITGLVVILFIALLCLGVAADLWTR